MSEQVGDRFARAVRAEANPGAGPRRYGEVGSAMDMIFGVPRVVSATNSSNYALPVVTPPRRRGKRVFGGIALVAVAAVAGVAMGVTVLDGSKTDDAQVVPARTAVRTPPVVIQAIPQANLAVAPTVASMPIATVPDPAPVAAATPAERIDIVERASSPDISRKPSAAVTAPAGACDGRRGAERFACLAERLEGADRELVDAYTSAAAAGVPRGRLVTVNRRWQRARDRAEDDPAEALRSYEDMADELWAARRRALSDDE